MRTVVLAVLLSLVLQGSAINKQGHVRRGIIEKKVELRLTMRNDRGDEAQFDCWEMILRNDPTKYFMPFADSPLHREGDEVEVEWYVDLDFSSQKLAFVTQNLSHPMGEIRVILVAPKKPRGEPQRERTRDELVLRMARGEAHAAD